MFKHINNASGRSYVSLICLVDSLNAKFRNPEFITVWIAAKQNTEEGKIFLSAKIYDFNGNQIRSSVQFVRFASASEVPKEYTVYQNFPNPFNPSTTLRYLLPTTSFVVLKIFDVLGQEVARFDEGSQEKGWHSVTWNAKVTAGMYFYRFEAADVNNAMDRFVQVRKMLYLK